MGQVAKQIIGSFEDIGKDVVKQAVEVPKEIMGQALENLGLGSKKQQKQQQNTQAPQQPTSEEKPVVPRQWLEELAGRGKKPPEPSVQERLEREKMEKKEKEAKGAPKMAPLQEVSTKPKRGNLHGATKRRANTEMSKNARQD